LAIFFEIVMPYPESFILVLYRLFFISICTCWFASVSAKTNNTYTLDELILVALKSSPQVLSARDQYESIKGQTSIARAYPNPEFEINSGQQRSNSGSLAIGNVSSWAVTQPLDMPYSRSPRIQAAEANLRVAKATQTAFEIEMIAKVYQRFYELMRREAEAIASEEDLSLARQIRDRMQIRYDTGETARFELLRSQTEFLNAQVISESNKLRVEQARGQLRQVVGHAIPVDYRVISENINYDFSLSLPVLLNEIQTQSPELQKVKAEIEAADFKLSQEKNSRLPKFSFKAQQFNDPSFTDRLYGLVVHIPIWDRKEGNIAEALANTSKAKNQYEAQIQSLEQQIETAYKLYQIARYQVKILDQEVLELASSSRRIAEVSYRYGERGMLEYLDAQRTFRAARNDLIKARFDLVLAITEIHRLRASPDWIIKLDSLR
jgi:cobalt-zinc-cadmium efflux system outer membrane protein